MSKIDLEKEGFDFFKLGIERVVFATVGRSVGKLTL